MALYASFSLASSCQHPKQCCLNLHNRKTISQFLKKPYRRSGKFVSIVKSVLRESGISDNGATEPARILLERLFDQTQKLEEQMVRDQDLPQVAELGFNLGKLELYLQDVLLSLKTKEEDLQDAERKISIERNEIHRSTVELKKKEAEIVAAKSRQEKLEQELGQAVIDLGSRAAEITDLKSLLGKKDREISDGRLDLSMKNEVIERIENEWKKKCEEAANAEMELRSNGKLLDDAYNTVEKQKMELRFLQREIEKKEEEIETSKSKQKIETERLMAAEAKLEKQTKEWLMVQEELKNLETEHGKHVEEANETRIEFERVKRLLLDVKSALVTSQNGLRFSVNRIKEQERMLELQVGELEEQKESISYYMTSLRDAVLEVEGERENFKAIELQNKKLKSDLSMERKRINGLRKELNKEKYTLKEVAKELEELRKELDYRNGEFEEKQNRLKAKESELAEARDEIQNLKSEQASLLNILKERDLELCSANMLLDEVNREISEMKEILISKEGELSKAMSIIKEKDEHLQIMHGEIDEARLQFSEMEMAVERIVDLTKEMVVSSKASDEYLPPFSRINNKNLSLSSSRNRQEDAFILQKRQLETEIQSITEDLKAKEIELFDTQKSLTSKDEELKEVIGKLDARENEVAMLKEEVMKDRESLNRLYNLAQETIGETNVGDLVVEKLRLEAAQLESEAATNALSRIVETSREFLNNGGSSMDDLYRNLSTENGTESTTNLVKVEVYRLLVETERLLTDAGIERSL